MDLIIRVEIMGKGANRKVHGRKELIPLTISKMSGRIIPLILAFLLILTACAGLRDKKSASEYFEEGVSLVQKGKYDEAMRYSEEKTATYAGNATQGKVSLCASLVRAAFADRSGNVSPDKQRLGAIGLEGLVRLGQHRAAGQLMEEYDIKLDNTGGFFLRWMEGRRLLAAAEQGHELVAQP